MIPFLGVRKGGSTEKGHEYDQQHFPLTPVGTSGGVRVGVRKCPGERTARGGVEMFAGRSGGVSPGQMPT